MKDMIPKGTGNSRFLRSVSNFKTIYPTYDDFVNALVAGNLPVDFNGINEAGIQQVGTPLNKANLLADETAALLGLGQNDPTVNDALNVLANIGNVHVWQRVQTYADPVPEVPAGYTLGAVEENVSITNTTSSADTIVMYSATSLTVSNDGTISTSGFGSASGKITSVIDQMYGKFIYFRAQDSDFDSNNIIFIPSDATRSWGDNGEVVVSKLQRVTGYPYTPAIPAGTHVDYLTSTDPNAYPKQSAEGGKEASYVLGDVVSNAVVIAVSGQSDTVGVNRASSITVSDDGVVSLVNPTGGGSTASDRYNVISNCVGQYVKVTYGAYGYGAKGVFYVPEDASPVSHAYGEAITGMYTCGFTKIQPVTGYPAIPANTVITYLGQLGGGARIEVGSYVGTGTYGSSNPNTLTFGFEPKLVAIFDPSNKGNYAYKLFMLRNVLGASVLESDGNRNGVVVTWSEKSVTWYLYGSKTVSYQMNGSGVIYNYIALG